MTRTLVLLLPIAKSQCASRGESEDFLSNSTFTSESNDALAAHIIRYCGDSRSELADVSTMRGLDGNTTYLHVSQVSLELKG